MFRKIVAVLILVPLAAVIVAFAVANRQTVTLSLDPFNSNAPAAILTLPLFVLTIGLLLMGVVIGGTAAWLRQGKWRRAARRLDREATGLRGEIVALRGAPESANIPETSPPPRLKLKPPSLR